VLLQFFYSIEFWVVVVLPVVVVMMISRPTSSS
jgi:hypothetical protein